MKNSMTRYNLFTSEKTRHGKCSEWIRENRRRRSAGIKQMRVLPFGLGIIDPETRMITKTLEDGTKHIYKPGL